MSGSEEEKRLYVPYLVHVKTWLQPDPSFSISLKEVNLLVYHGSPDRKSHLG
uniref:Uncharacterized protein n=1 Tax=Fundulus heteroclitus TaxID=8078 RepID=A0A3Q2UL46_FUNHE